MTTVSSVFALPVDATDQAIAWIARLRAPDVSAIDRSRFTEWLIDPRHRSAFDAMLLLWTHLGCTVNLELDARPSQP